MTVTYEDRYQSDLSLLSMIADSLVARPYNFWMLGDAVMSMSTEEPKEALMLLANEFSCVPWTDIDRSAAENHMVQIVRNFEVGSPGQVLAANALRWGLSNHQHTRHRYRTVPSIWPVMP